MITLYNRRVVSVNIVIHGEWVWHSDLEGVLVVKRGGMLFTRRDICTTIPGTFNDERVLVVKWGYTFYAV